MSVAYPKVHLNSVSINNTRPSTTVTCHLLYRIVTFSRKDFNRFLTQSAQMQLKSRVQSTTSQWSRVLSKRNFIFTKRKSHRTNKANDRGKCTVIHNEITVFLSSSISNIIL